MSGIDHSGLPSDPAGQSPRQPARPGAPGWRRPALVAGVLVGGVALGAGGLAVAATVPGHAEWGHGPRLELIQQFVGRELDFVGAMAAQEAKVHDIIAAAFATLQQDPVQRNGLRKQALDLPRAPAVDRAAAEHLRADQVARLDAMSKAMVGALLDAADQLIPAQRATLVDRADAMAQRSPSGGPGGGSMGGQGHAPADGEHGGGSGPGRGPDAASDRG